MAVHNKATTIKIYHNVDVNSNDKVLGVITARRWQMTHWLMTFVPAG